MLLFTWFKLDAKIMQNDRFSRAFWLNVQAAYRILVHSEWMEKQME